jgi:hypothetical protein
MKTSFFILVCVLSIHALAQKKVETELTGGLICSVGDNKYKLRSSTSQAVGVSSPTTLRYNNAGLRGRLVVKKSFTNKIHGEIQTGLTLRINEELWGYY